MKTLFVLILCALSLRSTAASWFSPATGSDLALSLLEPTAPATTPGGSGPRLPVVFYLENLAAPRVGTESDAAIIASFRAEGFLVVTLDYRHHPAARCPQLTPDFVALRRQIQKKELLVGRSIDAAHVFIVPAGCRLQRDVVFYRTADRTLAMDLIYPSHPTTPVGAVLEFSCDNANRMGNFSLDFCTDTLLVGAATEGFAAAMADHPVAAPYKGLDAMPDCAWITQAAVRTLRASAASLDLNGRIVPVGFSRGSGMALLLVTTAGHPEFAGHGEHPGIDAHVQGAVVLSGRFTYLDLRPDDQMIPRYDRAWGTRAAAPAVWRDHGALDHLTAPAGFPLFLSINVSEGPDALHQMDVLRHRLTELGSPFIYTPETEPRGHRVPLAPAVLAPLYDYLKSRLVVAAPPPSPSPPQP